MRIDNVFYNTATTYLYGKVELSLSEIRRCLAPGLDIQDEPRFRSWKGRRNTARQPIRSVTALSLIVDTNPETNSDVYRVINHMCSLKCVEIRFRSTILMSGQLFNCFNNRTFDSFSLYGDEEHNLRSYLALTKYAVVLDRVVKTHKLTLAFTSLAFVKAKDFWSTLGAFRTPCIRIILHGTPYYRSRHRTQLYCEALNLGLVTIWSPGLPILLPTRN